MKCTKFMQGLVVGMMAGGAIACLITIPQKKHCGGVVGRVLKTAGHIVENLSDAFGV